MIYTRGKVHRGRERERQKRSPIEINIVDITSGDVGLVGFEVMDLADGYAIGTVGVHIRATVGHPTDGIFEVGNTIARHTEGWEIWHV